MMFHALIVGVGGFLGSILRFWLSGLAHRWFATAFPVGTLLVNVLGCLAIGVFWSVAENRQWSRPDVRILVTVGILGGFTTFSAFGFETFQLLLGRRYAWVLANIAANVVLGILAVIAGWFAAKTIGA
jgi:fluoride exporter